MLLVVLLMLLKLFLYKNLMFKWLNPGFYLKKPKNEAFSIKMGRTRNHERKSSYEHDKHHLKCIKHKKLHEVKHKIDRQRSEKHRTSSKRHGNRKDDPGRLYEEKSKHLATKLFSEYHNRPSGSTLEKDIGMKLLRQMGWKPGQGLGKCENGRLEPLILKPREDRRGLTTEGDGKIGKEEHMPDVNGE